MIERIKSFLKKYNLQDKTIIVGFSGGFDSMSLLDLLYKIRQEKDFFDLQIIAAHFNHNWRGEESLKEQEVARLFATSRGFEFYTKTASLNIKKTENDARIARYDFFEEAMDYYDADAVFTAHNKDDNAETVLYRVIKGSGIVGLRGISERRDCFYRPLLKITRAEILDYCEKNNLAPNNDSSNLDTTYKRNYLRLNVLPSLEKINPSVKEALNTLAEVANNENLIIEEYLSLFRDKVFINEKINPLIYKTLSTHVKMRFLHEYIQIFNLDYDYKRIKEIFEFIENNIEKRNGATLSLTSNMWLYVDEKTIETIPERNKPKNEDLAWEVQINGVGEFVIGDKKFIIKPYVEKDVFVFPEATANFAYVNLSNIKFPFALRTRREGDIITPFGMSGTMKLKKFMNSKGINRHKRDDILVLAKDNEILWVVGVGLNNKIGVSKTPTHVLEVI